MKVYIVLETLAVLFFLLMFGLACFGISPGELLGHM